MIEKSGQIRLIAPPKNDVMKGNCLMSHRTGFFPMYFEMRFCDFEDRFWVTKILMRKKHKILYYLCGYYSFIECRKRTEATLEAVREMFSDVPKTAFPQ